MSIPAVPDVAEPMSRRVVLKLHDQVEINRDARDVARLNREHQILWKDIERDFGRSITIGALFSSVANDEIDALVRLAERRHGREYTHSRSLATRYVAPSFHHYLVIQTPPEIAEKLPEYLRDKFADAFQYAYVRYDDHDAGPGFPGLAQNARPIMLRAHDPRARPSASKTYQWYLHAAPVGLGIVPLWQANVAGADGSGQHFVDIERGWTLDHQWLLKNPADTLPWIKMERSNGGDLCDTSRSHGTAVLGVVCATHDAKAIIGFAPRTETAAVISIWARPAEVDTRQSSAPRPAMPMTADAIMLAAARLAKASQQSARSPDFADDQRFGLNAVLLIEAQANISMRPIYNYPVEIYPDTFHAIELATRAGITVIEPAGNGNQFQGEASAAYKANLKQGRKLAEYVDMNQPLVESLSGPGSWASLTNPSRSTAFIDSGAILVAAASHTAPPKPRSDAKFEDRPWTPWQYSNRGERVDCYAQGVYVLTAQSDDVMNTGTYSKDSANDDFGATSAAAAIIAGAALSIQGIHAANFGAAMSPSRLREAFRDQTPESGGTAVMTVSRLEKKKVGVIPNLENVVRHHLTPP